MICSLSMICQVFLTEEYGDNDQLGQKTIRQTFHPTRSRYTVWAFPLCFLSLPTTPIRRSEHFIRGVLFPIFHRYSVQCIGQKFQGVTKFSFCLKHIVNE